MQEALDHLREQQASFDPVEDRPVADGDHAQVSFVGTPKGEGQPVTVDDIMVEIGGTITVYAIRNCSIAVRNASIWNRGRVTRLPRLYSPRFMMPFRPAM